MMVTIKITTAWFMVMIDFLHLFNSFHKKTISCSQMICHSSSSLIIIILVEITTRQKCCLYLTGSWFILTNWPAFSNWKPYKSKNNVVQLESRNILQLQSYAKISFKNKKNTLTDKSNSTRRVKWKKLSKWNIAINLEKQ